MRRTSILKEQKFGGTRNRKGLATVVPGQRIKQEARGTKQESMILPSLVLEKEQRQSQVGNLRGQ